MSLRLRLTLLITLTFVLILGVAALFVIRNAREAVHSEVESTAHLTLQLLEIAIATAGMAERDDLHDRLRDHVSEFQETRHLRIDLVSDGASESERTGLEPMATTGVAPAWFARLVEPEPMEFRRTIAVAGQPHGEIVIRADPVDEIDEAWEDARSLLLLMLGCLVLADALVLVTLGRALRPVTDIQKALDGIEQGDYRSRLPHIDSPELAGIAAKFNHMAEALEKSRAENQRLATRNLAIQEEERRYLARELHDEMGQSISAIKAVAVSIGQRTQTVDPEVRSSAQTIAEVSSHVYEVVRGMMRRLRPAILDELGLAPALVDMVDDWNSHHGDVFCSLHCEGNLDTLGEEHEIGIYRIVQECLTNVAKHARANRVEIRLRHVPAPRGAGRLELTVQDDGIGLTSEKPASGLGLRGIRERVDALGGQVDIKGAPLGGVTLRAVMPVPTVRNAVSA